MAPTRPCPDPGTRVRSPELALVDPDFAAGTPIETETRDSRAVGEAIRRLTELSDVRPASRERQRTQQSSLVFAASAWATLAVVVVGSFPHGI